MSNETTPGELSETYDDAQIREVYATKIGQPLHPQRFHLDTDWQSKALQAIRDPEQEKAELQRLGLWEPAEKPFKLIVDPKIR